MMSVALGLSLFASCAAKADGDRLITREQLPTEAQSFMSTYFSAVEGVRFTQDTDRGDKGYDVVLADGTRLEFDSKGQWQEVDGRGRAIPTAFIPTAILAEVAQRYPQQAIVKIEKTDRGRYEVELISGVELIFGKDFKFISVERD